MNTVATFQVVGDPEEIIISAYRPDAGSFMADQHPEAATVVLQTETTRFTISSHTTSGLYRLADRLRDTIDSLVYSETLR